MDDKDIARENDSLKPRIILKNHLVFVDNRANANGSLKVQRRHEYDWGEVYIHAERQASGRPSISFQAKVSVPLTAVTALRG
ncbi:MAG: hypothetical protein IPL99_08645 [Candidatus Competibacteraceae bacterium]|nr:hypothetical protein [Candidatus Competibacteraceae bacterium]